MWLLTTCDFCYQTAQTNVIKSNLNPVWNQELMLSVPQEFGPLKLVSFLLTLFPFGDGTTMKQFLEKRSLVGYPNTFRMLRFTSIKHLTC